MLDKYESLFFVSAMERAKSMEQVAKDWGFTVPNLIKNDTVNKLLSKRLIRVAKIENRTSFFDVDFAGFLSFILRKEVKEEILKNAKDKREEFEKLLEDKEALLKFFSTIQENPEVRKKVFDTEKIKRVFPKREYWEDWLNAITVPFFPFFSLVGLSLVVEIKENLEKKEWESFKKTILIGLENVSKLPFFQTILREETDFFSYLTEVIKELSLDEFRSLISILLETKYWKYCKEKYKIDKLREWLKESPFFQLALKG